MKFRASDAKEGGFALFVVLAFLLLASAISIPFFTIARQYAFVSRNVMRDHQDQTLSEAILKVAAQRYFELANRPGGAVHEVKCQGTERYPALSISFQNHAGLIDLNAAPPELLRVGFSALGIQADEADRLAEAVDAYRTPDTGDGPRGTQIAVKGGLKRGLFESPAELLDFEPLQGASAEALGEAFTVYSRNNTLDKKLAAPRLQHAIKTLPQRDLTFLAETGALAAAFTVDIDLATATAARVQASTIYLPAGQSTVRRSGPVTTKRLTGVNKGTDNPDAQDCAAFLDKASLSILAELMQ